MRSGNLVEFAFALSYLLDWVGITHRRYYGLEDSELGADCLACLSR